MEDLDIVIRVVAKAAGKDPGALAGDTPVQALGLSSLDVLDVIFAIESELGVEIPDGALEDLSGATINDVAAAVARARTATWPGNASS